MDSFQFSKDKIFRGSFFIILFSLLAAPLGYFIRVVYSQTLSIEMYGLFYAVLGIFFAISTYNDLGFGYSVSYLIPKYMKKSDYKNSWKVFQYCQIIEVLSAVIISSILIIFAPYLETYFFKVQGARELIYIFSIYFISLSFLNALLKLFLGLHQEKYYSSISTARLFFTLLFSLIFIFIGKSNIIFYSIAWAIGTLITVLIYNFILYKKNRLLVRNTIDWDKKLFKTMSDYAIPTLITTSIYSFITFSDIFFLTLFRGVREVGIYNVVLPLVSISNIFLSPISNYLLPIISHLMEGEHNQVKYLLEVILKLIPFIGIYFGLFIIMFPSAPVSLLFGQKWVGLVESPLIILSIGYLASLLSNFLMIVASGMGKVKERLYFTMIIAVVCVILNAFFAYNYGVTGVVIANSIVYFLSIILFGKIVSGVISFRYPVTYYLKLITFSILIISIVKMLNISPTGWLQYGFAGVVYTFIMIGIGIHLNLISKETLVRIFNYQAKTN